jgi:hypothetical protein
MNPSGSQSAQTVTPPRSVEAETVKHMRLCLWGDESERRLMPSRGDPSVAAEEIDTVERRRGHGLSSNRQPRGGFAQLFRLLR